MRVPRVEGVCLKRNAQRKGIYARHVRNVYGDTCIIPSHALPRLYQVYNTVLCRSLFRSLHLSRRLMASLPGSKPTATHPYLLSPHVLFSLARVTRAITCIFCKYARRELDGIGGWHTQLASWRYLLYTAVSYVRRSHILFLQESVVHELHANGSATSGIGVDQGERGRG